MEGGEAPIKNEFCHTLLSDTMRTTCGKLNVIKGKWESQFLNHTSHPWSAQQPHVVGADTYVSSSQSSRRQALQEETASEARSENTKPAFRILDGLSSAFPPQDWKGQSLASSLKITTSILLIWKDRRVPSSGLLGEMPQPAERDLRAVDN